MIYCGLFVLILVVFLLFLLTTFRPNFTSGLFQVPRTPKGDQGWIFGLTNPIICFPYLVFHSQVRTKFVIVFIGNLFEMRLLNLRINFFIYCRLFVLILVVFFGCFFSLCFGQRIEALSLYSSGWALSEDSGFNSYPNQPEVYLVKNVVR